MMVQTNMEKDARLIAEEQEKALKRRKLGQQWMKDAEELYVKNQEAA